MNIEAIRILWITALVLAILTFVLLLFSGSRAFLFAISGQVPLLLTPSSSLVISHVLFIIVALCKAINPVHYSFGSNLATSVLCLGGIAFKYIGFTQFVQSLVKLMEKYIQSGQNEIVVAYSLSTHYMLRSIKVFYALYFVVFTLPVVVLCAHLWPISLVGRVFYGQLAVISLFQSYFLTVSCFGFALCVLETALQSGSQTLDRASLQLSQRILKTARPVMGFVGVAVFVTLVCLCFVSDALENASYINPMLLISGSLVTLCIFAVRMLNQHQHVSSSTSSSLAATHLPQILPRQSSLFSHSRWLSDSRRVALSPALSCPSPQLPGDFSLNSLKHHYSSGSGESGLAAPLSSHLQFSIASSNKLERSSSNSSNRIGLAPVRDSNNSSEDTDVPTGMINQSWKMFIFPEH